MGNYFFILNEVFFLSKKSLPSLPFLFNGCQIDYEQVLGKTHGLINDFFFFFLSFFTLLLFRITKVNNLDGLRLQIKMIS